MSFVAPSLTFWQTLLCVLHHVVDNVIPQSFPVHFCQWNRIGCKKNKRVHQKRRCFESSGGLDRNFMRTRCQYQLAEMFPSMTSSESLRAFPFTHRMCRSLKIVSVDRLVECWNWTTRYRWQNARTHRCGCGSRPAMLNSSCGRSKVDGTYWSPCCSRQTLFLLFCQAAITGSSPK